MSTSAPAARFARAVFLDRDGVLNEMTLIDGTPRAPRQVAEFKFLPGALEGARILSLAGFRLIVVTNQPDVSRGWLAREVVDAANALVARELAIPVTDVRVCWHDDGHGCLCRKPLPGMLVEAARDHAIDLARSFMVGDRATDVAAGHAAGCRAVRISRDLDLAETPRGDHVCASLLEAARWIVAQPERSA